MKVRVIESKRTLANCYTGDLLEGKVYNVDNVEKNFYRITDESGEDYIYHKDLFEIVEK
ncbi:MAG: hypothetical protein J6B60_04870 [Clostridia bacterium]|nr:hypothetical protein [Clostridia bacterium]